MRFSSLILKNLSRRRIRTALTSLGVAIAVGTMIALLGISDGFERSSADSFEQRGVDLVIVEEGKPDQLNSNLDERVAEKIRALPGVKGANIGLIEIVGYRRGNSDISLVLQGWEPDGALVRSLEIVTGRRLEPNDRGKVIIGHSLAESIGKKTGEEMEIQGEKFGVVGTYRSTNVFENNAVVVAVKELQKLMAREGRATGFSIMLDDSRRSAADIERVRQQILALRDDKGKSYRLNVTPTPEYVNGSMHIRLAHAMAWMTSAIAVVIGTVGMLNTMMMQVFERTKEIGVLRAIGWRPSRVVSMILGEAMALSLAGAILGGVAAVAITRVLVSFPAASGFVEGTIRPIVFVQGAATAVLVGVLGGLYPAVRASRLLPTEALRHE